MKIARRSGMLGLATLAAIASPIAMAQQQVPVWYGGLNIGQAREHFDNAAKARGVLTPGFAVSGMSEDRTDIGGKLYAGYRFHRNFAVEGGYFNLGKFDFTATTVPPGTVSGSMKVQGINADLVGILPISERFSAFGRVGITYAEAKDRFSGSGAAAFVNTGRNEKDWNGKFGLGLQYDFSYNLGMRLEAERYRIRDAVVGRDNIDLFSIGVVYRFGHAPAAAVYTPPPPRPAPPPPAAAPAPAPRVIETPPPAPQPAPLPPRRTRE